MTDRRAGCWQHLRFGLAAAPDPGSRPEDPAKGLPAVGH